ncbi:hypothetical protein N4G70_30925 [Streptomyces sp. ASQP_92]|nr:hypothetical protein [Streptomyces sp. ASQP_92]MCT9093246.1 hypothetical protein [Streptomyces sp. ASQP_92]
MADQWTDPRYAELVAQWRRAEREAEDRQVRVFLVPPGSDD